MTKEVVYNVFKGLNLKDEASLIGDHSVVATNCWLRNGKIQPQMDDFNSVTLPGGSSSLSDPSDQWEKGIQIPYKDTVGASDNINGTLCTEVTIWPQSLNTLAIWRKKQASAATAIPLFMSQYDGNSSSVESASLKLGVPTPTILTPTSTPGGSVFVGEYSYAITVTRTLVGTDTNYAQESGPSFVTTDTGSGTNSIDGLGISALDGFAGSDYYGDASGFNTDTTWVVNIYRLFNGEYRLSGTASVTDKTISITYSDTVVDSDLTTILPTQFQAAETGDVISYAEPVEDMFIAKDIYSGMLIGWKGNTLYWSDVGLPHAHPTQFNVNFKNNILFAVSMTDTLCVVTTDGVFVSNSTNPFVMEFRLSSNNYSYKLLKQRNPTKSQNQLDYVEAFNYCHWVNNGILYYASVDGLIAFDGSSTKNLTENLLPKQFFRDFFFQSFDSYNISLDPGLQHVRACVHVKNDILTFNYGRRDVSGVQTITIDLRSMDITHRQVQDKYSYQAIERYGANYDTYSGSDTYPVAMVSYDNSSSQDWKRVWYPPFDQYDPANNEADSALTFTYRSGKKLLQDIEMKTFTELEVLGTGTVTLQAYVDGTALFGSTVSLDFNTDEGRTVKLPEISGRALQWEVSGTGEVYEVKLRGK